MPRNVDEIWGLGIEHEINFVKMKSRKATTKISSANSQRMNSAGVITSSGRVFIPRHSRLDGSSFREEVKENLHAGERHVADWHIDGSVPTGVEIVTEQWKRATVESIISQIKTAEKKVLEKARENISTDVKLFPYGTKGMSTDSGMGSYHLAISIPAKRNEAGERYGKKVVKFLKQMQWIEPLLISNYGTPRITSVGDYGDYTEGSERSTSTSPVWGNAGGTRVDELLTSTSSRRYEGRSPKWRRKMIDQKRIIIGLPNIPINSSTNTDIDTGEGGSRTPLNTRNASSFPPRVELRFMDSFDSSALPELLKTVVYVASNSVEKHPDFTASEAPEDDAWNDAMVEVMEEGWNGYLPDSYVEKLRTNLKIPVATTNRRADVVLAQVTKELWEQNKDTPLSKKMIKNNGTVPKHFNINRDAWNFFFAKKMLSATEDREKFIKFGKDLAEIDASASDGNIRAGTDDEGNQKGIRQVLDLALAEYSAEDTRDILDYMEAKGLVKIKRNPDGSMDTVVLLYTADNFEAKFKTAIKSTKALDGLKELPDGLILPEQVEFTLSPLPSITRAGNFHVGDRVRVREDSQFASQRSYGVGTISAISGTTHMVDFEDRTGIHYHAEDLERASVVGRRASRTARPRARFRVGQRVVIADEAVFSRRAQIGTVAQRSWFAPDTNWRYNVDFEDGGNGRYDEEDLALASRPDRTSRPRPLFRIGQIVRIVGGGGGYVGNNVKIKRKRYSTTVDKWIYTVQPNLSVAVFEVFEENLEAVQPVRIARPAPQFARGQWVKLDVRSDFAESGLRGKIIGRKYIAREGSFADVHARWNYKIRFENGITKSYSQMYLTLAEGIEPRVMEALTPRRPRAVRPAVPREVRVRRHRRVVSRSVGSPRRAGRTVSEVQRRKRDLWRAMERGG